MRNNRIENKNGLILIISLWILALLSLLSLGLAHRVAVHIKLTKYQKDKTRLLYITKAAIQQARTVLESDAKVIDMLNEAWSCGKYFEEGLDESIFKDRQLQDGSFTASYVFDDSDEENPIIFYGMSDENRKININTDAPKILELLFAIIFPEVDSESLVDAIHYWRGKEAVGYESSYYDERGYSPRGGDLKTIQELSLVKEFRDEPERIQKCKKYLTVFNQEDNININTASIEVLRAVFMSVDASEDLSLRLSEHIIDVRDGEDNEQGTEVDQEILKDSIKTLLSDLYALGRISEAERDWINLPETVFPFTDTSNFFTIDIKAQLNNSSITKIVNSVIKRNDDFSTKVIYWHEK